MNVSKNFEEMNRRINDYLNSSNKKVTVVFFSEFGTVGIQHITMESCEPTSYAQYKNALRFTFKKRGGRTLYSWTLHEGKEFAIFKGWTITSFEIPESFTCFDKSLLYSTLDGMESEKIGESSERVYIAERLEKAKIYKVVAEQGGKWKIEIFKSLEALTTVYTKTGTLCDNVRRAELQGEPYLKNLCGPMYDGDEGGCAVIRYESQEVYNALSI